MKSSAASRSSGGVVGARRGLQAVRAGGLRQHRGRPRRPGEGEYRLQAVSSLVGGVHAAAGVDAAHLTEDAVRNQALQAAARGVIVELVVDRDLQRGGARKGGQRGAVGAVDGDRLLHDRRRHPGRGHLLQHLQPDAGRGVDVHHVGPFAGQHFPVVVVARGYPVVGRELVTRLGGARRHRHQPGARLVAVGQRMVARAPAAGADDHAPIVAAHNRYCSTRRAPARLRMNRPNGPLQPAAISTRRYADRSSAAGGLAGAGGRAKCTGEVRSAGSAGRGRCPAAPPSGTVPC